MAKSKRKQAEWSPQGPEEERAPRTPDEGAPQSAGDTTAANPDRDRLAQAAYERYLSRGGGDGQDVDDWLVAEQEMLSNKGRGEDEA